MSSVLSGSILKKPKRPKFFAQEEADPVQEVEMIEEEAGVTRRKERKKLLKGGRASTVLSGMLSALKKRLGE